VISFHFEEQAQLEVLLFQFMTRRLSPLGEYFLIIEKVVNSGMKDLLSFRSQEGKSPKGFGFIN